MLKQANRVYVLVLSTVLVVGAGVLAAVFFGRTHNDSDKEVLAKSIAGIEFTAEELAVLPDTELIRERLITELLARELELNLILVQDGVEYSVSLSRVALKYGIESACLKFLRGGMADVTVDVLRDDETDGKLIEILSELGIEDVEMIGARLNFNEGMPVAVMGTEGVEYAWSEVLKGIYATAEATINQNTVQAPVELERYRTVVEQDVTNDEIWEYTDVLGESITKYDDGPTNRNYNMELACEKLSGTVVLPGRSFSMYDVVSPFTKEEGYLTAGSLKDGLANEAIGGGVCQVTTTLYNAVLRAELDVTQRYNHSLKPTYVAPAFDATISSANVDFKFQNNSPSPVFICARAQAGVVSVKVYGLEARSEDRSIRFDGRYESSSGRYYLDKSIYVGQELVEVQTLNYSLYKD